LTVGLWHLANAQATTDLPIKIVHFKVKTVQKISIKSYSKLAVARQWKDKDREYECLNQLWTRESQWNPKALNKSSGAYGIAQFLPQTWRNYNYPLNPKDPIIQIKAGLRYITVRYKSPCKAWSFWQKGYWY